MRMMLMIVSRRSLLWSCLLSPLCLTLPTLIIYNDLDEGDYIDLNKNNETNGTLANPHSPGHRKAAASVCGSGATGGARGTRCPAG